MKIQFTTDVELEIYDSHDEFQDEIESHLEVFKAGETVEFDVFGHPLRFDGHDLVEAENLVHVQFGIGSVAYSVSTEWFQEL